MSHVSFFKGSINFVYSLHQRANYMCHQPLFMCVSFYDLLLIK